MCPVEIPAGMEMMLSTSSVRARDTDGNSARVELGFSPALVALCHDRPLSSLGRKRGPAFASTALGIECGLNAITLRLQIVKM